MSTNKTNGFWVWLISVVIAGIINGVVNSIAGFEYDVFSDNFNIIKLSVDLLIYVIIFVPTYYLIVYIINKSRK
ncbi:hypothetical protein [Serpentinicella alkaliphila]|uniref:Uncharacterized protein n=1 Tax=Serpentinicella alkaliphila TaxID=1734049 RepID=A0A4R2TV32_9FIRM|nr:hypothetical protein [Serpentinicella alkaliphila]QUH25737.1 hypothetical protein HZR23_08310 [Serpentinicella alkaliphila]TCP99012.1 hypothetical protein EDD79_103814 [Serpentinicella alkaliphila]